jgi:ABC-type phosphate transport system permease subunit
MILNIQLPCPSLCGVLKGVPSIIFGVFTSALLGVIPSKLDSISGVLIPPFNGVST